MDSCDIILCVVYDVQDMYWVCYLFIVYIRKDSFIIRMLPIDPDYRFLLYYNASKTDKET